MGYLDLSKQELEKEYGNLVKRFEEIKGMGLNLNMARGKPGKEQLDLSLPMLDTINSKSDFIGEDKMDCRNYGLLNGITECRKLFADILGVDAAGISIGTVDIMHEIIRIVGCMLQDRIINIRTGYGDPGIDIRIHCLKFFELHGDDFALLFCYSLSLRRLRCLHA